MTVWERFLIKGNALLSKADGYISLAAQHLMNEKGFLNYHLFGASFAGGGETVITFNGEGAMADLDIMVASKMSREEIIKTLSRFLSDEDIELLEKTRN